MTVQATQQATQQATGHEAERAAPFRPTRMSDEGCYLGAGPALTMGPASPVAGWPEALDALHARFSTAGRDVLALAVLVAYAARMTEDGATTFALCPALDRAFKPFTHRGHPGETFADVLGKAARAAIPGRSGDRLPAPLNDALPLAVTLGTAPRDVPPATLHVHCAADGALTLRTAGHVAPEWPALIGERLVALAVGIAAEPSRPLERQPVMAPRERDLVLHGFNATRRPMPYRGGLVAMMERRAAETPDHPAVRFMGETVTFAQFNERTNRLARVLREHGVGPDRFVALHMERSVEMVVALWAVLKAGGAYVPLNTEDPESRVAEIVADCRPVAVLTQERFRERFAERLAGMPTEVVIVPEGGDMGPALDGSDLGIERGFSDLAYMIYTSGSTGKPKGVVVEHGAIHNRVVWMHEEYGLDPADRVLQKTPYTFDVSVWEFLWSFAYGSTLVVAEPGGHMAVTYLRHLIRDEGVTHLHFVPSVLRMFLMLPTLTDMPIKKLFCSGEALPHASVTAFYAKAGEAAEVHNLYGPTEAAVDVSYYHCPRGDADPVIPIGRPVANTSLLVLDANDEPCPVGVPGELHIGGVQLARGYWGRPDITAERFVDNPVADAEHPRLYRTGDLACVRPDGEILYLGRNDFQVKINGVRMELGEIEAAIHEAGGVRDAVVVAEERAGNKVLVAYVVAAAPGEATAERLRAHVGATRPATYVPREVVFLPDLPLTSSGKADRKRLKEWPTAA